MGDDDDTGTYQTENRRSTRRRNPTRSYVPGDSLTKKILRDQKRNRVIPSRNHEKKDQREKEKEKEDEKSKENTQAKPTKSSLQRHTKLPLRNILAQLQLALRKGEVTASRVA